MNALLRLTVIFLFLIPHASTRASDWPQFLGPSRDGAYPGRDIFESWPTSRPAILWEKPVGAGFAGPVAASGRVILFHRKGDEEVVECLRQSSGERLWATGYATTYKDSFGFDEGPRGTPSIADGKVLAFGAQGVLSCFDFESGERIWSVDTYRKFGVGKFGVEKGFFGAACSPLIEGKLVLCEVGGKRQGAGIVAFDRDTGAVAWKATDHGASYSSPIAATIDGVRHALFFTRRGLVSIDPAGGDVRFDFKWRPITQSSVNAASPLVTGGRIFISTSYGKGAACVRPRQDGVDMVWTSNDALTSHYSTAVVREGHFYGHHGRQEYGPELRCVEAAGGKVKWSKKGLGAGTVTLAGDRLLVLGERGQLIVARAQPERFEEIARYQILPATVRAHPALASGLLFARNESTLVCVDLRPAGEKK